MKKLFLIFFFVLNCILANSQLLSSWSIDYVVTGGITYSKHISPGTPGYNIDFVNGVTYNLQGNVSLSSKADQDYVVYLKVVNSFNNSKAIKLGTIASANTTLDFKVDWTGDPNGNSNGTALNAYLYFQASGQMASGLSNTFITFTPRQKLVVPTSNLTTMCTSTQLSASATGGATPLTYSWTPATGLSSTTVENPIFSGAGTTTYTCTVKDSSWPQQKASGYKTVTVSTPVITGSSTFFGPCNGGVSTYSYNLSNVPPIATNIIWSVTSGGPSISSYIYTGSLPTGVNISSSGVVNGFQFTISCSYTVGSCTTRTGTFAATTQVPYCMPPPVCDYCPVSSAAVLSASAMTVYPNPTTDKTFTVNFPVNINAEVMIVVIDSSGNTIFQSDLGNLEIGTYSKSITLAKSGTYIVKVINGNDTQTQRVSLQ